MRWTLTVVAAAAVVSSIAQANPTSPTVVNGSATFTFTTSGATLTVTNSSNAIINWQSFSIGVSETTRFNQPSTSSVVLNRVTGPDPSSIMGSLTSNGHVFLTNPNGIVFGASAQVNVAGFVASTLDISNANFLSGNLQFAASGPVGPVINNGNLVASSGYIALIGAGIQGTGSITAGPGGVALAAGDPVTLAMTGDVLTGVTVGSNIPNTVVDVQGVINTTGPIFFVTNGTGFFSTGGDPLPPPIELPATVTVTLNTSGGSGNINTGSGNITAGTGSISLFHGGAITLQGTTTGASIQQAPIVAITLQGTTTGASIQQAPIVATGVTLNLEKRELSF